MILHRYRTGIVLVLIGSIYKYYLGGIMLTKLMVIYFINFIVILAYRDEKVSTAFKWIQFILTLLIIIWAGVIHLDKEYIRSLPF